MSHEGELYIIIRMAISISLDSRPIWEYQLQDFVKQPSGSKHTYFYLDIQDR